MVRLRPRLLTGCLALVCALAAPLYGCDKNDLIETSVPAEGVELRYALEPGATFEGRVRRQETINSRGQSMNRSIDFTVQLVVNEVDEAGNARVAATVHNINLNWNIPNLPISMTEFNARAKQRLEGVTIRFGVKPNGEVFDIPPTPPELDEAEAGVLDSVIEGLTSAFYVLPSERLKAGETWERDDSRGREGKLGKYTVETVRGELVGMFERRETKQQVAKLQIDTDKTETTTTKDGSSEIRTRGETIVLFDPQDNYVSAIESKMTRSQGPTVTTVKFDAEWTRSIAGSQTPSEPEPADAGDAKVQSISDPCDDNYVGPDDCLDPCNSNYMGDEPCDEGGETGGEAAPEAEAAPESDAGGEAETPAGETGETGE